MSEGNKADYWSGVHNTPLAPEGHLQAQEAAAKARQQGLVFDIIISSPRDRAHHTAKYVAQAVGYPEDKIQLHEGFGERNFGVLEGKQNKEVSRIYIEDETILDTIEGAERLVDLQWRAQQMLDYLNTLPHDTILVVGHGNFARAFRRAINKQPLHERGERFKNGEIVKLI